MNLILFEEDEVQAPLPYDDPRAVHLREILSMEEGDDFAAGIIGGKVGKGRLIARGREGWKWTFIPLADSVLPHPVTLVLGCPRPPVARRLLKDMTTLGVREIRSCGTDLNEKSYLTSKLWRDGLWRDAVVEGAVQGVTTHLPVVRTASSLERALEDLPATADRIALDNGSGAVGLEGQRFPRSLAVILAIGPERGWSDRERALLDARGFRRLRLGNRVLRTETACTVALSLALSGLGVWN